MEYLFVFTLLACLYSIGAVFLYYLIALNNTNTNDEENQFTGALCFLSWIGIFLAIACWWYSKMIIIFWPEPVSNKGEARKIRDFKPKL